jgi:hypothetical protein
MRCSRMESGLESFSGSDLAKTNTRKLESSLEYQLSDKV